MKWRGQHRVGKHTAEAQQTKRMRKTKGAPPQSNSGQSAVERLIAEAQARLKGKNR